MIQKIKQVIPHIAALITGGITFKVLNDSDVGESAVIIGTGVVAGATDTAVSIGINMLDKNFKKESKEPEEPLIDNYEDDEDDDEKEFKEPVEEPLIDNYEEDEEDNEEEREESDESDAQPVEADKEVPNVIILPPVKDEEMIDDTDEDSEEEEEDDPSDVFADGFVEAAEGDPEDLETFLNAMLNDEDSQSEAPPSNPEKARRNRRQHNTRKKNSRKEGSRIERRFQ